MSSTGPVSSVPPNGLQMELAAGVYNTTLPTPLVGQAVALQTDANGRLLVSSSGGGGGTVSGTLSNNTLPPAANNLGVLPAVANAAAPTLTEGNQVLLSVDLAGNLRTTTSIAPNASVNLNQVAGVALGATAVTAYGTTPAAANVPGVNAFVTNTVATTLASTTITGTVAVTQSTSPWVDNLTQVAGVVLGATAVTAFGTAPAAANVPGVNASLFSGTTALTNTAGSLNVNVTNSSGSTVTGTKSNNSVVPGSTNLGVLPGIANAATQTWTEGDQVLESMDLSGRQRVRGILTHNTLAPDADLQGVMNGLANAVAPTYTEGNLVLQSVDLNGNTRIVGTRTNNAAVPSFQVGVLPSVANAAAPTLTEGFQTLLSTDLAGNLRVKLSAGAATIGAVTGTLTNNNAAPAALTQLGVLPALANAANPTNTEGDQVLLSVGLSGGLRVMGLAAPAAAISGNPVLISGAVNGTGVVRTISTDNGGGINLGSLSNTQTDATPNVITCPTQAGGTELIFPVYPYTFNGTTWDRIRSATIGNAVAATGIGAHAAYAEYLSTAPAPTTGQYSALQTDYAGSLFTKPIRRSTTVSQATTISLTTSATTVLAAGAAGIFTDIANLVVTVTTAATTSIPFTVTLSDGTKSFIYDMETGSLTTAAPNALQLAFNPPLAATTAATAWTVTLSVATVVIHVVVNAVLQRAS